MIRLRLTLAAQTTLPDSISAAEAVGATMLASDLRQRIDWMLHSTPGWPGTVRIDYETEESPAPPPLPEDGPRERSAQPAPPPAPEPGPSAPTPRGPEARAPGPDPTVDGLAPEPGADPGPVPAFLVREPAP